MLSLALRGFRSMSQTYPYNRASGLPLLAQYLLLFLFPESAFSNMSIVPEVKKHYTLSSDEEFRVRYYVSRIGFEQLWTGKQRQGKTDFESFYQEHDKDIWRQAFLSNTAYNYKKKILRVYHVIRCAGLAANDPILDYGGGAGAVVHYLAAKGYKAIDMADIPSQTLTFVQAQMSNILRSVFPIDGKEVLQKNHYAAISALDCLEHTVEPLAITKRLIEALRPGGYFIVNFPKEVDFSHAHTKEAQDERDAVFAYLGESCETLVEQFVYRKRR